MSEADDVVLADWLSLLENRHHQEIQLGLDRIRLVAERLELLQTDAQVIMVAGTNGKGSTVATLESIYHCAGYKVASYTSPHLLAFNERIRFSKKPIDSACLVNAFNIIEQARGDIHLTYFEMTTLAALWYFKQLQPDIMILEVGLGGRLDATNIMDADLAIITTIDYDHQDFLGDTKEKIGYEKAGIIRQGAWFIYADSHPPESVIARAKELDARTLINGKDYFCYFQGEDRVISYQNETISLPQTKVHSSAVASSVIAIRCLADTLPVSHNQLLAGILQTQLIGRVQYINSVRPTLLDVAHNAQSAQYLAEHIRACFPGRKIHAVFSALRDKDIDSLIEPLVPLVTNWYPALVSGKRAASAVQLTEALEAHEVKVSLCYNSPVSAWQAACKDSSEDDILLIYGSFLTVAAVLEHVSQLR